MQFSQGQRVEVNFTVDKEEASSVQDASELINNYISAGLETYTETIETKVLKNLELYLAAFVVSLSHQQLEILKREQTEFTGSSFIFFSEDFVENHIRPDIIQL